MTIVGTSYTGERERERGESLNYVVNEGNSKGEKLFV